MFKIISGVVVAGALILGAPMAAGAVEVAPNVVVLWEKPVATFGPQHLLQHQVDTGSLSVFDSAMVCGHAYQVDRYNSNETTNSLIHGGILNAPNQPAESLVAGGEGVAYKTVVMPACPVPVKPADVVTHATSENISCESKVVTIHNSTTTTGTTLTNNVWVPTAPTTVQNADTTRSATAVECPVAVVVPPVATTPPVAPPVAVKRVVLAQPQLAFTGAGPTTSLIPFGVLFLVLGAGLIIYKRKVA